MSQTTNPAIDPTFAGIIGALESELGLLRCIVFSLLDKAEAPDLLRLTASVEQFALRWQPAMPMPPEQKALLLSANAGRAAVLLSMLRLHPAVIASRVANDAVPSPQPGEGGRS